MIACMLFEDFMIVYGEPNAAENWERLRVVAPGAQRIDNVRGIVACYAACAEKARTPFYFTVDADNWMLDGFDFELAFEPAADEIVLWYALNPVNGLRYAHGGIKLIPTALMQAIDPDRHLDFTVMAARNRYTRICASEHRFNADPYSAWAGAFRECAKLALASDKGGPKARALNKVRLDAWCDRGADAKFGAWCLRGAQEGADYGRKNRDDRASIAWINDFDWLRARFRDAHVRKVVIPSRS